jgi:hypothetical protein
MGRGGGGQCHCHQNLTWGGSKSVTYYLNCTFGQNISQLVDRETIQTGHQQPNVENHCFGRTFFPRVYMKLFSLPSIWCSSPAFLHASAIFLWRPFTFFPLSSMPSIIFSQTRGTPRKKVGLSKKF